MSGIPYPGLGSAKDVAGRVQTIQEDILPGIVDVINIMTDDINEAIGDEGTDFNALVVSILS